MIFAHLLICLIFTMCNCNPGINLTDSITSQLLFTGDDQERTELGVNLGPIDFTMAQWVFTNKFKHGNLASKYAKYL